MTSGLASLAVQIASAERTAMSGAHTTSSVARGKSAVMDTVCRIALRLRLRLRLALHTVVITAIVTSGLASLAVQMMSAERTAIITYTAQTTRSVARGRSAVLEPVSRLAPRLIQLWQPSPPHPTAP